MSAKDRVHNAVRRSLEKDGWVITDDPLSIKFLEAEMQIDLGAERVIGAQKDEQKIAVEIKSFLGSSRLFDYHLALGQYRNYQMALASLEPDRLLFLAVTEEAYNDFFTTEFAKLSVQINGVRLIVFDPEKEVLVKWES